VLVGRDVAPESGARADELGVANDLTVVVPAGTVDVTVHGILARAGEQEAASADGLR
jgi:hypothetical protein